MQTVTEKRWYLVQCKPRQDLRALANLQQQHYECLLPMRQVERISQGTLQLRSEPLFPGYLFIELDTLQDNWMPIRSTRGVSQMVRFDNEPLPVPQSVIAGVRSHTSAVIRLLQPGDRVRISTSESVGVEAIFEARDGTERVILLLNLLQRDSRVSVPVTHIQRLARHS
ncbi:transcription/translation regulatory transformer protein RfaH [Pseudomonas sp. PDM18]|uniref:transcription/translation regulatory transformer protein RfaH n=1 Tax=unclassified Pseudomonas TaxID=196821 RepID=UPI0017839AE4|nr:transcription/translation regulatory transformer protein RfaH [Pseudomonas sp. PDM18]MBD9677063.1 transcription/translation regulatory transformer protein RfaH [Pseudomonas sp. PDM18]